MAVGAGFPVTAIFVTVILLLALVALGRLEDRLGLHTRVLTFTLAPPGGDSTIITRVHELVEQRQVRAQRWKTHRSSEDAAVVEFDAEVTTPQESDLIERLTALKFHYEVRPAGF